MLKMKEKGFIIMFYLIIPFLKISYGSMIGDFIF